MACVLLLRAATPANFVFVHSLYFPILLAAFWFKLPGGVVAGLLAGVAASPYVVGAATPSEYQVGAWLVRSFFFLGFGVAVGYMCNLLAHRQERLESNNKQLARTYARTLKSLVFLLEHHDEETSTHCERVAANALRLGEELGFSRGDLELLYWAAYLHDIGKLASPARMLLKDGPLSAEEYEVMKRHATIGAQALSHISKDFVPVAPLIRTHHERWDGQGYPRGMSGENIPLESRILAVADAFDALTHDRSHRKAVSATEAAQEIGRNAGTQFDPAVVAAFQRVFVQGLLVIPQDEA